MRTPTKRLADLLLEEPVENWIRARRQGGRSWRLVARDLYEATNGQVDVTPNAVRTWAAEDQSDEQPARAS